MSLGAGPLDQARDLLLPGPPAVGRGARAVAVGRTLSLAGRRKRVRLIPLDHESSSPLSAATRHGLCFIADVSGRIERGEFRIERADPPQILLNQIGLAMLLRILQETVQHGHLVV